MEPGTRSKELRVTTDSRVRIGVAGFIVGALIGILLGFVLDDGNGESSPQDPGASVAGPGPSTEANGVPLGYAHTEEGALAAARGFALLTASDVIRDKDAYVKAMRTIAAPDWLEDAEDQAVNGYEFLVDRYGEDVDVSAAVLRYDIVDFSPTQAEIKFWVVSVAAGSLRSTVDEVWGTAIVELAWVDGDWRVSGAENTTGPAPVDLPTSSSRESAASLMEELDEFVDFAP
jgi:hypothetical protein